MNELKSKYKKALDIMYNPSKKVKTIIASAYTAMIFIVINLMATPALAILIVTAIAYPLFYFGYIGLLQNILWTSKQITFTNQRRV